MFLIFELKNKHKKQFYADSEGNYFYAPQDPQGPSTTR